MRYRTHKGRKQRLMILGAMVIVLCAMSAAVTAYVQKRTRSLEEEHSRKLESVQLADKNRQRMAYVTSRDIQAGEWITSLDVTYETVYSSMDAALFAEMEDAHKLALIDIPQGTQLLEAMVREEEIDSHVREEEFGMIYLSGNLEKNDRIDVRLFFPNGENYIVLSKKSLQDIRKETSTCYLWLDEQETLLISAAIIDAYRIPGAYLYTTRYVEDSLQEPSVITYTPDEAIITLIEESPNILEEAKLSLSRKVRQSLMERTNGYLELQGEGAKQELADFVKHGKLGDQGYTSEISHQIEENEEEIIYVD